MQRHLRFTQITVSDEAFSNCLRDVAVASRPVRRDGYLAKRWDSLWRTRETESKELRRTNTTQHEGNMSGSLCAVFFFISHLECVTLPRRRRISLALITRPAGRVNVVYRFATKETRVPGSTGRTRSCRSCIRNKGKRIHGLSLRPLGNVPSLLSCVKENPWTSGCRLCAICGLSGWSCLISFLFTVALSPFVAASRGAAAMRIIGVLASSFSDRIDVSVAGSSRFVGNFVVIISDR